MALIDHTHDATRRSWVQSANGHPDFPIQNLPLGVFSTGDRGARGGVAIGDAIFDVKVAHDAGLFDGDAAQAAEAACEPALNTFMGLGPRYSRALRHAVSDLLDEKGTAQAQVERAQALVPATSAAMHLPARIGDYTDFYAGIHHATTIGKLFRPDAPLLPNYKYVPIGYHGRASSIRLSGAPVVRPKGQRKPPTADVPTFGPCARLDYELELGLWIGRGNSLGEPIGIAAAGDRLFGISLLNDWSARDLQTWEYQPLGPFLAKNFMTTLSPWIVTTEALAPFRTAQAPRPAGDPAPLPYLLGEADQREGALDIALEVELLTARMRADRLPPLRLSQGSALDLYWTAAQLITHHASNGCNLQPGDVLGTGTISGLTPESAGSLIELSKGGSVPLRLPTGETRSFLEDGDEVRFCGRCTRDGFVSIGFGACSGIVMPSPA
ncbi:MAG: fumarylacetoacetase [Alphaproteobacteria bacterium]|nr:fumarylacetoacetase [Alphaproteobacteria bacterium]